jgi:hypothetical protein
MSVETDIIEGDEATNGNDPIIVKKTRLRKKVQGNAGYFPELFV